MSYGFQIGNIDIPSPVVLAPMAGYTDYGLRFALRHFGFTGLFVSELLSCRSLYQHKDKKLGRLIKTAPFDWPISWQIFGYEPEFMAYAAKWLVENNDASIIDINMGCSVRKVLKRGAGSGLLKDLRAAEANLKAVIEAVDVPVTVKMRLGWGDDPGWLREAVLLFQDTGAKIICLHARQPQQGFKGEADWKRIAEIKDILKIPVIGNGDIKSVEDGLRMRDETGCDGVMVGRAILKDPMLPVRLHRTITGLEPAPEPTFEEFMDIHLKGLVELHGPVYADIIYRKWRGKYPKKIWDNHLEVLKRYSVGTQ